MNSEIKCIKCGHILISCPSQLVKEFFKPGVYLSCRNCDEKQIPKIEVKS